MFFTFNKNNRKEKKKKRIKGKKNQISNQNLSMCTLNAQEVRFFIIYILIIDD